MLTDLNLLQMQKMILFIILLRILKVKLQSLDKVIVVSSLIYKGVAF